MAVKIGLGAPKESHALDNRRGDEALGTRQDRPAPRLSTRPRWAGGAVWRARLGGDSRDLTRRIDGRSLIVLTVVKHAFGVAPV
jgi:hypothetical protein